MPLLTLIAGAITAPLNLVRAAIGIKKDWVETKKAEEELRRLQDERRSRDRLSIATAEDVERYDPKRSALERAIGDIPEMPRSPRPAKVFLTLPAFVMVLVVLGLTTFFIVRAFL